MSIFGGKVSTGTMFAAFLPFRKAADGAEKLNYAGGGGS
jgi:hypothetical protein